MNFPLEGNHVKKVISFHRIESSVRMNNTNGIVGGNIHSEDKLVKTGFPEVITFTTKVSREGTFSSSNAPLKIQIL